MPSSAWTSTRPEKTNRTSSQAGGALPGWIKCVAPGAVSHLCSPARFHNKGVYVKVGLQKISHSRSLHKELQLQVDKQDVPLPHIEGLIFLNIPR